MEHKHGYSARIGGIIVSHKPGNHHGEELDLDSYEPLNCGLCNEICWTSPNATLLHLTHPEYLVLCCGCGHLAEHLLTAAIPGVKVFTRPVPDLAEVGMRT